MGDMADMAREEEEIRMLDELFSPERRVRRFQKRINRLRKKGIWLTKDGIELDISEMETSHIRNCLAMIVEGRMHPSINRDKYAPLFQQQLVNRGETP